MPLLVVLFVRKPYKKLTPTVASIISKIDAKHGKTDVAWKI